MSDYYEPAQTIPILGSPSSSRPLDMSWPCPNWPGLEALLADGWELARGGPAPRIVMQLDELHRACIGGRVYVRTEPRERAGRARGDDADGYAMRSNAIFVSIEGGQALVEHPPISPTVFVRDDGGMISVARVKGSRYADRLPTNRKRKKARAQERRAMRRLEARGRGWF